MDHLTPEQIAELKSNLTSLGKQLASELTAHQESSKPVQLDEPIGRLSRMDALTSQGLAEKHLERAKVKQQQVKAALERIENGTFGICIKTGEEISFERLMAAPEVPFAPFKPD